MSTRHEFGFSNFQISLEDMHKRDEELVNDVKKAWTMPVTFPTCHGWEKVVYDAVIRNSNYLMLPIMKYRAGQHVRWVFQFSKGVLVYVKKNPKESWGTIRFSHSVGRWLKYRILQGLLLRSSATHKYAKKCTKIDQCTLLSEIYAKSRAKKISMDAMMIKRGEKFERRVTNRRSRKRRLKTWDDQYLKEQKKKNSN